MQAFLLLDDGTRFYGTHFGALESTMGEVVFSTSMSGYQEGITDPSYYGQILVLTYPLIGNVGANDIDSESKKVSIKGLIIKELCEVPSNWAVQESLEKFMKRHHIVGIKDIDTRALVLKIRNGVMKGMICLEEPSKDQVKKLKNFKIENPIEQVSTKKIWSLEGDKHGKHVAVLDFGVKENMLRVLHNKGYNLTIFPAKTSAKSILAFKPDGLLLSNGPGNPSDNDEVIKNIQGLLGKLPIMGICMGHQLLALACGLECKKMQYGHRGINQAVKDIKRNSVFITSQNHGYEIDPKSVGDNAEISHYSVNDNSIEGLRYKKHPSFSVQFHPEACPGPIDTAYLFDDFFTMMEEFKNAKKK